MSEDGSEPLANARRETYSQARSKDLSQAASYAKTVPFGTEYAGGDASLRASGCRLESKYPKVRVRIAHLTRRNHRNGSKSDPEALTRGDIVELSLEVTGTLEAFYSAALTRSCSPQQLERLKSVWVAHLSRQGKLDEANEPLPDPDGDNVSDMTERIADLRMCTCPVEAWDEIE